MAYTQISIIEWLNLIQLKGENVQAYMHEFKMKYLALETPLHTPETLLMCIGGLHSYHCHTILMFNLTNIDELSVQDTHMEVIKGKHGMENVYKKPPKFENQSKGKEKGKNI